MSLLRKSKIILTISLIIILSLIIRNTYNYVFASSKEVTEISPEFKGYAYNDNTKQAIRVVDKYFLIPKTTTKMYTDTDVQTMSTYSYEETECKIENND